MTHTTTTVTLAAHARRGLTITCMLKKFPIMLVCIYMLLTKANLDLQNNVHIQRYSHVVHVHYGIIHVHVVTALYGHYFAVYMYNDYM